MRIWLPAASAALLAACVGVSTAPATAAPQVAGDDAAVAAPMSDQRIVFPQSVQQGALVIGKVPTGSAVRHDGRMLRPTPYGSVVFGVARDAASPLTVEVQPPGAPAHTIAITVTPRDWPIERINGVPPKTVNPPPEIAARIEREQAAVAAARQRDGDEVGFAQHFIWPVHGRISGRFGRARSYNGQPGSAHSGMDIAVPAGTPVRAPASGVITFAAPDLYLTGGTVLLDHGHGVSSNFLHLSRIDVKVGDVVRQGEVIGAVGATGRATGPHLHWGMNWFEVRIDPLLGQVQLDRGQPHPEYPQHQCRQRQPQPRVEDPHQQRRHAVEGAFGRCLPLRQVDDGGVVVHRDPLIDSPGRGWSTPRAGRGA